MSDAFIPEEGETLKDDIFSDPAYRDYSDLLHGPYIAALIRRSKEHKARAPKVGKAKSRAKASAEKPRTESASTLSDSAREAFRDAQEEIKWVSIAGETPAEVPSAEAADGVVGSASFGSAWETTSPDDDFGHDPSIDDDFEVGARP